jgi:hypothetical protein
VVPDWVPYTELMSDHLNGWDVLHHGDAIRQRVRLDGSTVAQVAADAGLDLQSTIKANWLAGAYPEKMRAELGRDVLAALTPAHLEAVIRLEPGSRVKLLRKAAADHLTVRALRKRVGERPTRRGAVTTTTPDDLERAVKAMETYAGFDDSALRRLVTGPNGRKIRNAADAGRVLAARIEEFST